MLSLFVIILPCRYAIRFVFRCAAADTPCLYAAMPACRHAVYARLRYAAAVYFATTASR